ncbi:hypothetical protein IGI04_003650 [Brassica rapa subsp. trilocularis]|uniref:HTH myb-type domain-containing protein n=1 Tax=Brassica rapa subsp. trilocularis TaxID=1813537 RepID=A0ABQ7NZ11_BRACM|nr:hypothetical protein IGI04_003650 [Brassica rapa subsp. trilocularis]
MAMDAGALFPNMQAYILVLFVGFSTDKKYMSLVLIYVLFSVCVQLGLQRCGKSCRLRWINYLRPDLKRGSFSPQEAALIIELHSILGNSIIANTNPNFISPNHLPLPSHVMTPLMFPTSREGDVKYLTTINTNQSHQDNNLSTNLDIFSATPFINNHHHHHDNDPQWPSLPDLPASTISPFHESLHDYDDGDKLNVFVTPHNDNGDPRKFPLVATKLLCGQVLEGKAISQDHCLLLPTTYDLQMHGDYRRVDSYINHMVYSREFVEKRFKAMRMSASCRERDSLTNYPLEKELHCNVDK